MQIDKERVLKRFEGRGRSAPHSRAEMIDQVCDGLGVDKKDKAVWQKWNGVCAGIPLSVIYAMLQDAKRAKIPVVAAFTGNIRKWRKQHSQKQLPNC